MTSIQERLQMKREPLDKWSIREQLCLASAVSRSGDQNWMSVSRALKPFGEPNRPSDWFHQKNCAAQYGMLLANVETPKRKKRTSVDSGIETPAENILKRLLVERQTELKKLLAEEKAEYQKLQDDMALLQAGKVSEEQLDRWCREIDEEEYRKDQEAIEHTRWLKEREQRKQEIERAWRPMKPNQLPAAKRKSSEAVDISEDHHQMKVEEMQIQPHQLNEARPALSPLLTSLLKSPSQVQAGMHLTRHVMAPNPNATIASLLNSSPGVTVSPGLQQLVSTAIGQEPAPHPPPQPPQLAPAMIEPVPHEQEPPPIHGNDILGDANFTNIKIDDLANSMLVQDGPLPEIKKEEVDDIISEIIENVQDIVDDPEQHLQLDGNGDININLDNMDDLEEEEEVVDQQQNVPVSEALAPPVIQTQPAAEAAPPEPPVPPTEEPPRMEKQPEAVVDPFEFREDPVIFEPVLKPPGTTAGGKQDMKQYTPLYQQQQHVPQQQMQTPPTPTPPPPVDPPPPALSPPRSQQSQAPPQFPPIEQELPTLTNEPEETAKKEETIEPTPEEQGVEVKEERAEEEKVEDSQETPTVKEEDECVKKEDEMKQEEKPPVSGSVEIVEVASLDSEEDSKDTKTNVEDIVQMSKSDNSEETKSERTETEEEKAKTETETESYTTESKDTATYEESSEASDTTADTKKDTNVNQETQDSLGTSTVTPDFSEDLYDEISMEVKIDKSGKAKRDYSRTKKREDAKDESGFDMLLAIEKSQQEDGELTEGTMSDNAADIEQKDVKPKLKPDNEGSNSPWTEEEEDNNRSKRRYSTPATPVDSVPNSPASSSDFYRDDKDYRNWKKSVMLVYNELATNKYASLFLKPITDDQAPGYSTIVYRPMDLQTIKKNIENGVIRSNIEFKRDVMLMFTNAMMYNKTNDTIYSMALQMQKESLQSIEIHMQATSQENAPIRRETRTSESGIKRKRTVTLTDEKKKKKDD